MNHLPVLLKQYEEIKTMTQQFNTLLAEIEQLKAHNRQLVEAAKESLAFHHNWRSTAEPEELYYYSEHKLVIGGLKDALQSLPAKLALAEAEVLRAAENLASHPEDWWEALRNLAAKTKAMKEARSGSDT